MSRTLRLGTRRSVLAVWQAKYIQTKLETIGQSVELIPIASTGDQILDKPLHSIGTVGLFTKALDDALLEDRIDLAVHSLKDLPTEDLDGLVMAAVSERAAFSDLFISNRPIDEMPDAGIVATGSLRRRAQWLRRYPDHQLVDLRGNIQKRLEKLEASDWLGAIFASAAIQRLELDPVHCMELDWMIPAPAQGVIGINCRKADQEVQDILQFISDPKAWVEVKAERAFLNELKAGCTAPVGAKAALNEEGLSLKGIVLTVDGTEAVETEWKHEDANRADELGRKAARQVLEKGAKKIIADLMERGSIS